MQIFNECAFENLAKTNYKANLILTDLPYIISKQTGFASVVNGVKRFAVSMDFGEWDKQELDLPKLCRLFYANLEKSGTCIIFYDLWKLQELKIAMEEAGFIGLRLIVWEKTNPVPLNSKLNYLSNGREMAIVGNKGGKPTFNSEYDIGTYRFPIEHSAQRIHPTQKPLRLFEQLVAKHSNTDDVVLDPFMGSGTTGVASLKLGREFVGIERGQDFFKAAKARLESVERPLFAFG